IVVVTLYLSLNLAYLWVLTPAQMAASPALAADMARAVAGEAGAQFVAFLIVVSSLGFLAVVILTGPRLIYAMASDGLFFRGAARLHPRYQTPVFALWLFFGLTAAGLLLVRSRESAPPAPGIAAVPGHPWTTGVFVLVAVGVV